jgi:tetratricopeptide (TPR) repeat protein
MMNIDIEKAQNNLLTCATYLSTKIRSSDGFAEATKELVSHYLAKGDVDFSADLADTVDDTFIRDNLLIDIACKCIHLNDDEYGMQLAEAVEDFGHQSLAKERIIEIKAQQKDFEKAFQIAQKLPEQSNALSSISFHQDLSESLQTIDKIESLLNKVHALVGKQELDRAEKVADEIDFNEEQIRAYLEISLAFIEQKRNDRAIEVLTKTQFVCEKIEGTHRDSNLSQVALLFFRAGSVDLADRTLDSVVDKYHIASSLVGFSNDYFSKDEVSDAIESLEEALEILNSQSEKEVRNSQAKFDLFAAISVRFARLGKFEKAIDIADKIRDEDARNIALLEISKVCISTGNINPAHQSLNLLTNESDKTIALIGFSDIFAESENSEKAIEMLTEAFELSNDIPQLTLRIDCFGYLSRRFFKLGDATKSRDLATKSLENTSQILDETQRVMRIAELGSLFDDLNFEINDSERQILFNLIRKAEN